ncbi:MAG: UTP--glucose-1-phosphate uridylyltransferase, partial [Actinomycetes bacterium]
MSDRGLALAREKMSAEGVAPAAIETFTRFYHLLESGETGLVREADVEPLTDLPRHADLDVSAEDAQAALARTAIIKLNGGLGTSMGMDRAKSLLCARRGLSFLDIIARQVLHLREKYDVPLPLIFMNSFRTSSDTLAAVARYQELPVDGLPLEFQQNKEPKLLVDDLAPVSYPK